MSFFCFACFFCFHFQLCNYNSNDPFQHHLNVEKGRERESGTGRARGKERVRRNFQQSKTSCLKKKKLSPRP